MGKGRIILVVFIIILVLLGVWLVLGLVPPMTVSADIYFLGPDGNIVRPETAAAFYADGQEVIDLVAAVTWHASGEEVVGRSLVIEGSVRVREVNQLDNSESSLVSDSMQSLQWDGSHAWTWSLASLLSNVEDNNGGMGWVLHIYVDIEGRVTDNYENVLHDAAAPLNRYVSIGWEHDTGSFRITASWA